MNDRDRLEQLRALLVRLERMPESAERDWMLAEVRGRAVDVETGVKPAAMRRRSTDSAESEIPAAPKASRRTVPPARDRRRPAPRIAPAAACSPPPPARRQPAPGSAVDLLEQGGVLSLEDQPPVADAASRPWSGGLRG